MKNLVCKEGHKLHGYVKSFDGANCDTSTNVAEAKHYEDEDANQQADALNKIYRFVGADKGGAVRFHVIDIPKAPMTEAERAMQKSMQNKAHGASLMSIATLMLTHGIDSAEAESSKYNDERIALICRNGFDLKDAKVLINTSACSMINFEDDDEDDDDDIDDEDFEM